jgi:hypothetical protein
MLYVDSGRFSDPIPFRNNAELNAWNKAQTARMKWQGLESSNKSLARRMKSFERDGYGDEVRAEIAENETQIERLKAEELAAILEVEAAKEFEEEYTRVI